MSYTYSLNWMGPLNRKFLEQHGHGWAGGRMECYHEDWMYPKESAVPLMKLNDWERLSSFLNCLKTDKPLSFPEIEVLFLEKNPRLTYFKETK